MNQVASGKATKMTETQIRLSAEQAFKDRGFDDVGAGPTNIAKYNVERTIETGKVGETSTLRKFLMPLVFGPGEATLSEARQGGYTEQNKKYLIKTF